MLTRTLATAPYREPTWSERGSMYWNIDRIRLSAADWERIQLRDLSADGIKVHPSFVPAELPMPGAKVTSASRRFVCDVLKRNTGTLHYPARQTTHPAPEQRLRRMIEALQPIADRLPETGGSRDFKSVVDLQQSVSPILAHIYRETGVYVESLHAQICTLANADNPEHACR